MKAIDNSNLKVDLHYGLDCVGFEPRLNYAVTNNNEAKQVEVTDVSIFPEGDTLLKVLVHVTDVDGNQKHDVINLIGEKATINLAGFNMAGMSLTATVITDKGCKADLGVYNLSGKSETAVFTGVAKQGTRN